MCMGYKEGGLEVWATAVGACGDSFTRAAKWTTGVNSALFPDYCPRLMALLAYLYRDCCASVELHPSPPRSRLLRPGPHKPSSLNRPEMLRGPFLHYASPQNMFDLNRRVKTLTTASATSGK